MRHTERTTKRLEGRRVGQIKPCVYAIRNHAGQIDVADFNGKPVFSRIGRFSDRIGTTEYASEVDGTVVVVIKPTAAGQWTFDYVGDVDVDSTINEAADGSVSLANITLVFGEPEATGDGESSEPNYFASDRRGPYREQTPEERSVERDANIANRGSF